VSVATSNLPITVFLEPLKEDGVQPFAIYAALMALVAAVVVGITGPANLSARAKQAPRPDRPAVGRARRGQHMSVFAQIFGITNS
jgi:hypothetical protein